MQLSQQELMKTLLTPLNIAKVLICLKIQGLLKRAQPSEQLIELLTIQPPGGI